MCNVLFAMDTSASRAALLSGQANLLLNRMVNNDHTVGTNSAVSRMKLSSCRACTVLVLVRYKARISRMQTVPKRMCCMFMVDASRDKMEEERPVVLAPYTGTRIPPPIVPGVSHAGSDSI